MHASLTTYSAVPKCLRGIYPLKGFQLKTAYGSSADSPYAPFAYSCMFDGTCLRGTVLGLQKPHLVGSRDSVHPCLFPRASRWHLCMIKQQIGNVLRMKTRESVPIADENCVLGDITYPGPSLFHLLLRPEIFIEPHSLLKHREIPTSTLNLFQSPTASDSLYTPPRMSSISLLGRSTEIYADAAAFGIHIFDNHSLFEGEELFEGNPIEDLYDQVYTLRRWTGEPIAHMPVSRI